MSTANHALPHMQIQVQPDTRIAIVGTEWNAPIVDELIKGALDTLQAQGVAPEHIEVMKVPGSFELIYAAAALEKLHRVDAIIAIGCVIRGDTPHFDYICQGVTQEIARLNAQGPLPVIFGLLTTNTEQQALDRAGGTYGNKGNEFAQSALQMVALKQKLGIW